MCYFLTSFVPLLKSFRILSVSCLSCEHCRINWLSIFVTAWRKSCYIGLSIQHPLFNTRNSNFLPYFIFLKVSRLYKPTFNKENSFFFILFWLHEDWQQKIVKFVTLVNLLHAEKKCISKHKIPLYVMFCFTTCSFQTNWKFMFVFIVN